MSDSNSSNKKRKATAISTKDSNNSYSNDKTVYIEGLDYSCSEEAVREFFGKVGEITSLRLPRYHDSGRLRGYGHIEYKTATSAEKALELSGEYLGERYVMVDRPQAPKVFKEMTPEAGPEVDTEEWKQIVAEKIANKPPGCRKIFVKNLPYDTTEEEVSNAFKFYGPITSTRLASWGHTNNLKGFGYIDFKREDSAEIAVKKSGSIRIRDRPIAVDFDGGEPKASFKSNSRQKGKSVGFTKTKKARSDGDS